jgi:hypothetical protein
MLDRARRHPRCDRFGERRFARRRCGGAGDDLGGLRDRGLGGDRVVGERVDGCGRRERNEAAVQRTEDGGGS